MSIAMVKNIVILYTEAGGGHKAAALALKEIIERNPFWRVTLINPFQTMYAKFDLIKKVTGLSSEEVYNKLVSAKEHSFINLLLLSIIFKFNLYFYYSKLVEKISIDLQEINPDMLISVTPFINQLFNDAIKRAKYHVPFVTMMTDYSECAKNIWIVSKDQFLICGSKKLVEQAESKGHPKDKIFPTSGMIVNPSFYDLTMTDKKLRLQELGLQGDLPTGIVIFGSHGSACMLEIAKAMNNCTTKIQLIFICGKNTIIKAKIDRFKTDYPKITTGFIPDIQNYMAIADFFIGKPGGASISEASIMKLPIIVKANIFTLFQERYNAKWVEEKKIGVCVSNFSDIAVVVTKLLENISVYKKSYAQMNNRGVLEIPAILEKIFNYEQPT